MSPIEIRLMKRGSDGMVEQYTTSGMQDLAVLPTGTVGGTHRNTTIVKRMSSVRDGGRSNRGGDDMQSS